MKKALVILSAALCAALVVASCGDFFNPQGLSEEQEAGPVVHRPALTLSFSSPGVARGYKDVAVDTGLIVGDGLTSGGGSGTINTAELRDNLLAILQACGADWTGYAGAPDKAAWIADATGTGMVFSEAPNRAYSLAHGGTFEGVNPYVYLDGVKKVDRYWSAGWTGADDPQKWANGLMDRITKYVAFFGLVADPSTEPPVAWVPADGINSWSPIVTPSSVVQDSHGYMNGALQTQYAASLYGLRAIVDFYSVSFSDVWDDTTPGGANNDDDRAVIEAALGRLEDLTEQFYRGIYPTGTISITIDNGSALTATTP